MRGQQTEADRIAELERDPQCSQFDAHRCLCAACGRWVHLSGRAHKIFNWRRHKKGCTLQKARGAITIIQSKSPLQRTHVNDSPYSLDDGIRMEMDVEDDLELEKRSAYTHSDDGFYDAPPSPNTSHSSLSTKSGSFNPNSRSNDKRYLQLPSITTFALSPTGSTSTPPLTSSDAASCSTTTSDSGHSLISSWSQSQARAHPPYAPGVNQTGSWGRASHRPRGASTSSFRSLPPLSATSSGTATSIAGSPSIVSKHAYRPRGPPTSLISCEGCQTMLEAHDWSSHKRSCRAYGRLHQVDSTQHGYHHTHSHSQPTTILPPLITTTSPNSEPSHVLLRPSATSIEILDAGYGVSKGAYKRSGMGDATAASTCGTLLRKDWGISAHSTTHRHSPPRLSIDTSFSRGLRDPGAAERKDLDLTAHGDRSHIGVPDSYRRSHESVHVKDSESRLGVQSRLYGDAGRGLVGSEGLRPSSRASSLADVNHSPTSTRSSSGRSSLKISDLCHPSPPRSPDSDGVRYSSSCEYQQRSRSGSPHRARSWSRNQTAQYMYPGRPQHPSSEDNSTTPTHTPLLRTTISGTGHSILPRFRAGIPLHRSSFESEDSSSGFDMRQVQYNYSQSRSTFQSEPDSISVTDSDYDSEDERDAKIRRMSRRSPLRSLSPPSPYISDA